MPVEIYPLRRYVLTAHRSRPEGDRPTWVWALPSAEDLLAARAAQHAAGEGDQGWGAFGGELLSRCLREVRGLTHRRQAVAVPADLEERRAWVSRLRAGWWAELVREVQADGELDEEEE